MSDLIALPAPATFPAPAEFPAPLSPDEIGNNPYGGPNFVYGDDSLSSAFQRNTQVVLQNRAIQQARMNQAAQFASAQVAASGTLETDPSTWTPEEAAQQTDRALAKLSTVNPELAQHLSEQRTGEDSGGGFMSALSHAFGVVTHPFLAVGGEILDIVSRTANIVPNVAYDVVDGGDFDIVGDLAGAVTGNVRHNWNSVFQKMGWEGGGALGWMRAGLGLGFDIATDPLTWLIPAGTGMKLEEAAAMGAKKLATESTGIRLAAEHVTEYAGKTNGMFGDIGEKMNAVYDAHFTDVVEQARRLGKDVKDLDERFFTAIDATWSQKETELYRQMFELGDRGYRTLRTRGLKGLKDGFVLHDGTKVTAGEFKSLLEAQVKKAGGAAYGSSEWSQGRAFASIAGGLRMKLAVPFTSLRYISPSLDIARFWGSEGRYAGRLLGNFNNFFAGQSGMVGLLKKIGEGGASWEHMAFWMENGYAAFQKEFRPIADSLGGKYQRFSGMFYNASESVGRITAALTPHAAASRAGLAGYHYGVRATVEAKSMRNAFMRDIVNKALGGGAEWPKMQVSAEAAFQDMIDDPDIARYLESVIPALHDGVDIADPAEIEAWFHGRHPEMFLPDANPDMVAKMEARLEVTQKAATRFDETQRGVLENMAKIADAGRDLAAKHGAHVGDARYNFEDARGIPEQQVPLWRKGAGHNHPITTDEGTTFYIHAEGRDLSELEDFGITDGHMIVDEQGNGFTVSSKRLSPEDKEVSIRGNYMQMSKNEGEDALDANLVAYGDQAETTVGEARKNISKAVRADADAVRDQRAKSSNLFDKVRAGGDNAHDVEQLERMEGEALTEEMSRRMPQHAGTYHVAEDGTITVNVWDKKDLILVGDEHAVVDEGMGYFHRMLDPKVQKAIHGEIPKDEAQILLDEANLKAELSRLTLGQTFDEANAAAKRMLTEKYPKLLDAFGGELPESVFSTNLIDVHASYLENLGRDVEARVLGRYAERAGRLGRLAPQMFGAAPRGQEFEWALSTGKLAALKKADKSLAKSVFKMAKKGAKFQKAQHAFFGRVAKDWGDMAMYRADMLERGLDPMDTEVQRLARWFERTEDVKATIDQARQTIAGRKAEFDTLDAELEKTIDDYAKHMSAQTEAAEGAELTEEEIAANAAKPSYEEARRYLEGEIEEGKVYLNTQTGSVLNKDGVLVKKGGGRKLHPKYERDLERRGYDQQLEAMAKTEQEVDAAVHPDLGMVKKPGLSHARQTVKVTPEQAKALAQRLSSNPGEADRLAAYIEEHGPFVYHGTHPDNLPAINEKGILSEKGRGMPPLSDEEFDAIDEPYMYDGVYTGDFERASEHGSAVVGVDLRKLDDNSVYEFAMDGDSVDISITENIPEKALVRERVAKTELEMVQAKTDKAATSFDTAAKSHSVSVREVARLSKLLERARHEMERAMNSVNEAAAKSAGIEAQMKPALEEVTSAGARSGLTMLRVPGMERFAMPKYIAEEWHAILDQHGPKYLSEQWRKMLLGPWKRWATYRNPGFHVRNFFGAWFNNFLGGVTLADYGFSHRVNSVKFAEKPLEAGEFERYHIANMLGKDAKDVVTYGDLNEALVNAQITGGNVRSVTESANTVDALEDAFSKRDVGSVRKGMQFVDGKLRQGGEYVENFHRVAAWGRGMAATEGDSYGARAFTMLRHGDYADLTPAEEHIRDIVPFYKWMRTNIPYQIRMLAENPAQMTLISDKIKSTAYDAYGVDRAEAERGMPDFMKQTLSLPIPGWVPFIGTKDPNNLKYAMLDLPYSDLYNGFNDYISAALPLVRNLVESYGAKEQFFTGKALGEGKQVELSGVFNLPGIRNIIAASPFAQQGPNGGVFISDTVENVLTAFPMYSRFRNFAEADPERVQQRLGGLFSFFAGIGVREADFTAAELDFYYNEVEPTLTMYRDMGVTFPTADQFMAAGNELAPPTTTNPALAPDENGSYFQAA